MAVRPWLCPTPGPSPGQPGGLDCFERKPLGGGDPSSHCRWEGRTVHLGTVSEVIPLDFCFAPSRQSRVKDSAGTVVELLDPLVTGLRKASAQGCSPCPGIAGGNEPLSDQTPGPQPINIF